MSSLVVADAYERTWLIRFSFSCSLIGLFFNYSGLGARLSQSASSDLGPYAILSDVNWLLISTRGRLNSPADVMVV